MKQLIFINCFLCFNLLFSSPGEPFEYLLKDDKTDYYRKENDTVRRGSWIRRGSIQREDILLSDKGIGCNIVVGKNENSAVQRAAGFLAKDIQKISGYVPPIITEAEKNRSNI